MDLIDKSENTREVQDGRIRIAVQLQRDICNFVGSLERLPFATWPVFIGGFYVVRFLVGLCSDRFRFVGRVVGLPGLIESIKY